MLVSRVFLSILPCLNKIELNWIELEFFVYDVEIEWLVQPVEADKSGKWYVLPPWRNGLACWTSNSKVVGSSPTGGVFCTYFS